MLVAAAILMVAPSASAFQYTGPTRPDIDPSCPVTEPGSGGIEGQVKDAAHLATSTACGVAGAAASEAVETAMIGYDLAMAEVDLVMTVVGPVVDGTQSNVCNAVYGPPPHDGDLGCSELKVDLQFVALMA